MLSVAAGPSPASLAEAIYAERGRAESSPEKENSLNLYPPHRAVEEWVKSAEVKTIPEMFRNSVEKNPDGNYLGSKVGADYQYLSYRKTQDSVMEFASALIQMGLKPGDRVATFSDNRPEWPITDLGTIHAGCVHAPLFNNLAPETIKYTLRDSGAKVLVVDDESKLKKVLAADLPDLQCIVVMEKTDLTSDKKILGWDEFLKMGRDSLDPNAGEISKRLSEQKGTDVCSMVYTSGTTGDPKGVMLSHANLLSNVSGIMEVFNGDGNLKTVRRPEDIALSFLPLAHAFERAVYYSMTAQTASIAYPESVGHFAKDLKVVRPTVVAGAPLLLNKFYQKVERVALKKTGPALSPLKAGALSAMAGAALGAAAGSLVGMPLLGTVLGGMLAGGIGARVSSKVTEAYAFQWSVGVGREFHEAQAKGKVPLLTRMKHKLAQVLVTSKTRAQVQENTGGRIRLFISGGAPLRNDVAAFLLDNGFKLSEGYGLSETSPVITVNPPAKPKVGTVGQAITGVDVKIAEDGEILASGPNVMNGYLNKPDKTLEAVDKEGWLHTGDIGTLDSEKYLRIVDRKKNLLVLATGKKVAPSPIEDRLKASPYIQEAVVVGDNRTHVGALLVPNFENLTDWAKSHGIPTDPASLAANEDVKTLLKEECERLTSELSHYEQVKSIAIVDHEFTVESGEYTPTLKVKRKFVQEKYSSLIDEMYGAAK